MRSPVLLDAAILAHQSHYGKDPEVIFMSPAYRDAHSQFFAGKMHQLCCGRGYLYCGIMLIFTEATYVEDFLLGY